MIKVPFSARKKRHWLSSVFFFAKTQYLCGFPVLSFVLSRSILSRLIPSKYSLFWGKSSSKSSSKVVAKNGLFTTLSGAPVNFKYGNYCGIAHETTEKNKRKARNHRPEPFSISCSAALEIIRTRPYLKPLQAPSLLCPPCCERISSW